VDTVEIEQKVALDILSLGFLPFCGEAAPVPLEELIDIRAGIAAAFPGKIPLPSAAPAFKISVSRAVQAAPASGEKGNGGWEVRLVVEGSGELASCVTRLQARVRKKSGTIHSNFLTS